MAAGVRVAIFYELPGILPAKAQGEEESGCTSKDKVITHPMKRDMDLVRKILFDLEADKLIEGQKDSFRLESEGVPRQQIAYHLRIMCEGGLVSPEGAKLMRQEGQIRAVSYRPYSLTWDGHEFLDQIRRDTVWQKAKDLAIKGAGAASLTAIKLALPEIMKQLMSTLKV